MDESKMDECRHIKDSFDAYLSEGLSPPEKNRIEEHLASCESCRRALENEKQIIHLLGSMEAGPAPEALRQNVLRRLQEERLNAPSLFRRLAGALTLPRLRILTGVAGLAILVFLVSRLPQQKNRLPTHRMKEREQLAPSHQLSQSRKPTAFQELPAEIGKDHDLIPKPARQSPPSIHFPERLAQLGAIKVKKIASYDHNRRVRYSFLIPPERLQPLVEQVKSEKISLVKVQTPGEEKKRRKEIQRVPGSLASESTEKNLRFGGKVRSPATDASAAPRSPREDVRATESQRLGRNETVKLFRSTQVEDSPSPASPTPSPTKHTKSFAPGVAPGDKEQKESPSPEDYYDHQNLVYVEIEVTGSP